MLIQPEKIRIILEIPDLVIDNTIIKRKAYMHTLTYNQEYNSLSVNWLVKHFSNNNGSYGEYIGSTIADKSKETIADMTTIVKYPSGEIIEEQDYPLYQENGELLTLNRDGEGNMPDWRLEEVVLIFNDKETLYPVSPLEAVWIGWTATAFFYDDFFP